MKDTCDRCVHCTHVDKIYYFCEIDNKYINEKWALDETIGCDAFVEKLDDYETEE